MVGAIAGGAALLAATALGISVGMDTQALSKATPGVPVQSRVSSINGRATATNVLFGAGGVVAAGGLVLWVAF